MILGRANFPIVCRRPGTDEGKVADREGRQVPAVGGDAFSAFSPRCIFLVDLNENAFHGSTGVAVFSVSMKTTPS